MLRLGEPSTKTAAPSIAAAVGCALTRSLASGSTTSWSSFTRALVERYDPTLPIRYAFHQSTTSSLLDRPRRTSGRWMVLRGRHSTWRSPASWRSSMGCGALVGASATVAPGHKVVRCRSGCDSVTPRRRSPRLRGRVRAAPRCHGHRHDADSCSPAPSRSSERFLAIRGLSAWHRPDGPSIWRIQLLK